MNDFQNSRALERREREAVESALEKGGDVRVDYRGRDLAYIGDRTIPIRGIETSSCNCMLAEAGTTGHTGGNSGCLTYIRVRDLGSTQVREFSLRDDELEIVLEGDSELDSAITVLEGLAMLLRKTMKDAEDQGYSDYEWLSYRENRQGKQFSGNSEFGMKNRA